MDSQLLCWFITKGFLSETSSKSEDPFYCPLCRLSSQNREILYLKASALNNLQLEFSTIKQQILARSNSESGLSKLTVSSHTTLQKPAANSASASTRAASYSEVVSGVKSKYQALLWRGNSML